MAKATTAKPAAKKPSTAVSNMPKPQLPVDAKDQMAADVAALGAKLAAPTGKSILVTQSKEFKFPDETKVESFKAVIVAFASMNAYYEGAFDRDNLVPPNCFAIGLVKNDDLDRSPNSPEPQTEGDETACAGCWANQWKSAPVGNGKACKNSIRLALLCDDGEIRPLNLSSTALKPFGEYVRNVVNAFGVPPYGVMTEFTFDPKQEYASVRCGDPLPLNEDQLALVMSIRNDAQEMVTVEPDVSEFEEKVVAKRGKPAGKGKLPAAKGRRA